jgi:RNA recognition motif-containing protein
MPTSTVWVGGLAPNITEDMLDRHFARYGRIKGLGLDRKRGYCMVSFEHIAGSTFAHNDLKERNLFGKRVRVRGAEAAPLLSLYITKPFQQSHNGKKILRSFKVSVAFYRFFFDFVNLEALMRALT